MAHFEPWRIRILGFAKKGDFIYSIRVNVIIQYVELTGFTNHRRVRVGGKLFSEVNLYRDITMYRLLRGNIPFS